MPSADTVALQRHRPANSRPRFSNRVRLLLWIDRRVGALVCLLLTALRRMQDAFTLTAPASPCRRILFIKLVEQGSTVLAHSVLRDAIARGGRENVFFIAFEENRFVVDVLNLIPTANVLAVRTRSPWTMATSGLARLRDIRRLSIDTCINLEFFSGFAMALTWLSGATRRIGFHPYFGSGPYCGDLLTHRVPYNAQLHTGQSFLTLTLALDCDPSALPALPISPPAAVPPPRIPILPDDQAVVQRLLADRGIPVGTPLVLLNANASDLLPLRKWADTNYARLAQRLLAELPEIAVVFTGAPDEAPVIAALAAGVGSPRCHSLAGATSLRQLLTLFDLAEVLVTNDSGPGQFAALTGVDIVVLFGPETPQLFAPPGPRTHVLWAGLACSPCINAFNNRQTSCRSNLCMQAITVDQVFDLVCQTYRQRTRRAP